MKISASPAHRPRRALLAAGILGAALTHAHGAQAASDAPSFHAAAGAATGRYLVDFVDDVSMSDIATLTRQHGVRLQDNSPGITDDAQIYVGELSDAAARALLADPRVEGVEPEISMSLSFVPDDPLYAEQWHMSRVDAEGAWSFGCGRGITVAVIDTGVACFDGGPFSKGSDLGVGSCVAGYNFVADDEQAADDHGHGTHVAGTIAQATHNALGTAGLAHCATLMPVKVLSAGGMGTNGDVAEGIRFAADHGAQILNLSLGGPFPSAVVGKAVKYAQDRGVLVVAAAGNSGGSVGYPAAYPGVLAVSASDRNDNLAWFSSRGPQVGIAAPGVAVTQQTVCNGGADKCEMFATWNGTSMATPHVAAAAALLMGAGITDAEAVRSRLQASARPKDDPNAFGAGILDAGRALRDAQTQQLLVRGLALVMAFLWVRRRVQTRGGQLDWSLAATLGALTSSVGLLAFLPWIGGAAAFGSAREGLELLGRPLGEWGLGLLGAGAHRYLVYAAAVPPVLLTLFGFGVRRMRPLIGGVALGSAAYSAALLFQPEVQAVAGGVVLRMVLVPSVLLCLWLARTALDRKGT